MSERQKYNRMWMSKQLGDKALSISNLSELNEKKKHQIRHIENEIARTQISETENKPAICERSGKSVQNIS